MFIRKRCVNTKGKSYEYHSIVETRRENGKPRQKLLYNMGRRATIAECIEEEQKRLDFWRRNYDPDQVVCPCARTQARIDWLKDAANKMTE
jgi:hypothetical protein